MYLNYLIPSVMATYALIAKKITLSGVILAWILGIIIYTWGGLNSFIALALVFILTITSDKIKKTKRDHTRNLKQMVSNVLTAGLCIILYYITNKNMFYVMYYAVIASSLSDTLASSIGTLSKKKPFNMFTMKQIEPGESGGVSVLGLVASLLGGIIIGVVYLFSEINFSNFLLIILMGFVGSLFDSVLGTVFEAKYECKVCKKNIDTELHCSKKAILINGHQLIDNNMVNLLNNIFIFVLSYILLY